MVDAAQPGRRLKPSAVRTELGSECARAIPSAVVRSLSSDGKGGSGAAGGSPVARRMPQVQSRILAGARVPGYHRLPFTVDACYYRPDMAAWCLRIWQPDAEAAWRAFCADVNSAIRRAHESASSDKGGCIFTVKQSPLRRTTTISPEINVARWCRQVNNG